MTTREDTTAQADTTAQVSTATQARTVNWTEASGIDSNYFGIFDPARRVWVVASETEPVVCTFDIEGNLLARVTICDSSDLFIPAGTGEPHVFAWDERMLREYNYLSGALVREISLESVGFAVADCFCCGDRLVITNENDDRDIRTRSVSSAATGDEWVAPHPSMLPRLPVRSQLWNGVGETVIATVDSQPYCSFNIGSAEILCQYAPSFIFGADGLEVTFRIYTVRDMALAVSIYAMNCADAAYGDEPAVTAESPVPQRRHRAGNTAPNDNSETGSESISESDSEPIVAKPHVVFLSAIRPYSEGPHEMRRVLERFGVDLEVGVYDNGENLGIATLVFDGDNLIFQCEQVAWPV